MQMECDLQFLQGMRSLSETSAAVELIVLARLCEGPVERMDRVGEAVDDVSRR